MSTQTKKVSKGAKAIKVIKLVSKTKPTIKVKAKSASAKVATQKVIMDRDLKYIYPEAIMNDKLKMKSFRGKVRKALVKMEADLGKLKGKDKSSFQLKFDKYRTSVLVNA